MWLRTVAGFFAAIPLLAQFNSLSTDYNGSRLYLVSRLSQQGTSQPFHGKLFIADRQGVRPLVVIERNFTPYLEPGFNGPDPGLSNYYDITSVSLAKEAGRLSFTSARECRITSSTCGEADTASVYDSNGSPLALPLVPNPDRPVPGALKFSPDGNWAISTSRRLSGPIADHFLIDFRKGTATRLPVDTGFASRNWQAHSVANNGTAALAFNPLTIVTPSGDTATANAQPDQVAINAEGTLVVWAENGAFYTLNPTAPATSRRDLGSGNAETFPNLDANQGSVVELSNDGRRLLFLSQTSPNSSAQVYTLSTDGTARKQVTTRPEGIANATLSGDGQIAWAVSRSGALLRIELDSGATEEWIAPVNALADGRETASPGQPITLKTFASAKTPLRIKADNNLVPVLAQIDGAITIQIPWESTGPVTLTAQPNSPQSWVSGPFIVDVAKRNPRAEQQAIHQNFTGVVTQQSPAYAGEIVHIYASGLGPVVPPVATGQPAPASPLSLLRDPLLCSSGTRAQFPPIYAGLAPGTVGYYQVSIPIPNDATGPEIFLRCSYPDGTGISATIPLKH